MRDYPSIIKKHSFALGIRILKNKKPCGLGLAVILIGLAVAAPRLWYGRTENYALAQTVQHDNSAEIKMLIAGDPKDILTLEQEKKAEGKKVASERDKKSGNNKKLENGLYEIVGDSPIREMIPFIAQRDEKVAAFLIGIAKKESSFGFASPSKDGMTCYNYWGYKGSAGRGTGMGYACFASAEEAVRIVGDRIGVLVEKKRDTPSRMVDTWKCGRSCAGDPGAPGWVSTVALYFNKIVSQNV